MFHYPYYFHLQQLPPHGNYPCNQVIQQADYYSFPYYNVTAVPSRNGVRQYPDVDATLFTQSAISMQQLMKEASILLNKFAESKDFAYKVMSAAQKSNVKEVERLIKTTGIKSKVITTYNPDGITLKLSSKVGTSDCCHLTIVLRWR
ncbi:hypothetical protein ACFOU2_08600 [Bacillus songklensis]|uniref:Spore coat protein n=1 Tax=Bacillus songklensis TaxID=1069116 RepID=A0ABV8B1Q5_9BACI